MASPGAVLDGFAAAFPLCASFLAKLRRSEASLDIARETDRQLNLWAIVHEAPKGPGKASRRSACVLNFWNDYWVNV
jgi:hypothetical protein